MSVLRRLSHAFTGNHNTSEITLGGEVDYDLIRERSGLESHGRVFPDGPAFASSYSMQPYSDDPLTEPYEESFVSSRHSDDYADRRSIAPSYLTSALGTSRDRDSDDDSDEEGADKYSLMTAHLHQRAQGQGWFKSKRAAGMGAVSVRIKRRHYRSVSLSISRSLCES